MQNAHLNLISINELSKKSDSGFYFDIITVSSIIGGFMFTSLSILMSVSSNKIIRVLERSKHMDSVYFNISFGLAISIFVIALSLTIMFFKMPLDLCNFDICIFISKHINELLLFGIASSILSFTLSINDLRYLIKEIRKSYKLSMPTSEIEKELKNIPKSK